VKGLGYGNPGFGKSRGPHSGTCGRVEGGVLGWGEIRKRLAFGVPWGGHEAGERQYFKEAVEKFKEFKEKGSGMYPYETPKKAGGKKKKKNH